MGRATRRGIIAGLFVVSAAGLPAPAHAAVWAWGCQGQLGAQQVIFNREQLFVVEGKKPFADVRKLINAKLDALAKGERAGYNDASNGNDGFVKTITFSDSTAPDRKLVLTEKSSSKIAHKRRLICGRDEDIDIFRKTYRYERDGEPAHDITMQCIEYQLSTRGGRDCN